MDTLAALRDITAAAGAVPLWSAAAGAPTGDLAAATHARLGGAGHGDHAGHVELDAPVPVRVAKGTLTLRALVYLWAARNSAYGQYLVGARGLGAAVPVLTATVPERTELLDWLRGAKATCSLVGGVPTGAGEAAARGGAAGLGAGAGGELGDDGPALGDAMDVDVDDVALAARHVDDVDDRAARDLLSEYTLRTRSSYLTPPTSKDFSSVAKLAFDVFQKNRQPPAQSTSASSAATAANATSTSSSSRKSRSRSGAAATAAAAAAAEPIILVPPGYQTKINMFNARQLLESASYVTPDAARRAVPDKPARLEIVRRAHLAPTTPGLGSGTSAGSTGAGGGAAGAAGAPAKPWKVVVMDSVDMMQPADWDRVIAVFAGGFRWQFDGWRWSNPVELFGKVRGYHLKYADEEPGEAVRQWNVKVLQLHRTKRHLDLPLVLEFWADLERWVAAHKPHLLPQ